MVLKLWKNGFSIDDGPLRDFKDPANKEFLDSVSKGFVFQWHTCQKIDNGISL